MKVALSSFNFIPHPRDKKRITPEGDSQSSGIKTYGKFMGWLRSHLGSSAVELKDKHHVWYVKKEDLVSWAEGQGVQKGFDLKQLGQVLENVNKPVNVKVETKPKPIENEKKPEVKEKATDAEFQKTFWDLAKKLHPDKAELISNYDQNRENQLQKLRETEVKAFKLVINDLENKPNKTAEDKQKIQEFRSRLDNIAGEKLNELHEYIKSIKIESKEQIAPAVKEWMKKYQAIAKIGDLDKSEKKELSIVNNAIAEISKADNPNEVLQAYLLLSTRELTEKLIKKINP